MAHIEVETKLRVKNVADARKRIEKIAGFIRKEKKIDDYYALNIEKYPQKSLRIRRNGREAVVNFKKWINYKDGVHAKKEVEFKVSDLNGFFELLENFGFKKWVRKEKLTELYKTKDNVPIELSYVKRLGWYIEIEILCNKNKINLARKRIVEIRKLLEMDKDVEKKGYTRELWGLRD